MALVKLPGFEALRDRPFVPQTPRGLRRHGEDLWAAISRRDILLHHPYDSFAPVVDFVTQGGRRPQGAGHQADALPHQAATRRSFGRSIQAAENGKHVTALVELQARFDEAANVTWARQLERSGVHVVFGFMDLKTHCKVSLVVRQEGEIVRRYVHLATGNYNPATALVYTDLGLFTADPDIGEDVSALFNLLTGYSQGHKWRKLIVAPNDLAPANDRADRRTGEAGRQGTAGVDFRQAQLAGRSPRDRVALPGQPGGRADRAGRPRDLLLAAGRAGRVRKHQRAEHRRSVPGAQPDLRLRAGGRRQDLPLQRRLDAAEFLPPRRSHVPDRSGGPAKTHLAGNRRFLPSRQ